ncbi:MAG: hypothetical protein NWE93_06775 [Candidatus Bathyarchaeota archaeon]|nr:hypothetical protein [Candidatus Bathyarchaeota archaeon]
MILVVDLNWKPDSLAKTEFVAPIVSVVESFEGCVVKHFLEVDAEELGSYSRIILSGTTLKDFEAQAHLDCFSWIKTCDKPILGICAGMQIISLIYGVPLQRCLGIGMTEIKTTRPNLLFSGVFQAYTLHSLTATASDSFDVLAESDHCIQAIKHRQKTLYGVLFHPEVRNPTVLQRFLTL